MGTTGTTAAAAAAAAAVRLADAGVPSPEVDARWLVEAAAGIDPRRRADAVLPDAAVAVLATLVARRAAREPLQQVVGTTAFRALTLACAPGVFVPRPETEVLAGLAVSAARASVTARGAVLVVEPCCGSGAVALSVAAEVAGAHVIAGDAAPVAVALTARNRDRLAAAGALRGTVDVRAGHLLDVIAPDERGRVDVVVANPPYLPHADLPDLPPEVADHDPHAALFGGADGHELVGELLAAAAHALAPGGTVLLEIDARRGDDAVHRARGAGLEDARLHADLTGAPRFLSARRPGARGAGG